MMENKEKMNENGVYYFDNGDKYILRMEKSNGSWKIKVFSYWWWKRINEFWKDNQFNIFNIERIYFFYYVDYYLSFFFGFSIYFRFVVLIT